MKSKKAAIIYILTLLSTFIFTLNAHASAIRELGMSKDKLKTFTLDFASALQSAGYIYEMKAIMYNPNQPECSAEMESEFCLELSSIFNIEDRYTDILQSSYTSLSYLLFIEADYILPDFVRDSSNILAYYDSQKRDFKYIISKIKKHNEVIIKFMAKYEAIMDEVKNAPKTYSSSITE